MKARIGLLAVLLAFPAAACGGDDDDEADAGDIADAGPPDVPVATGFTAAGGFAGARAIAQGEHADAVLFEITSDRILANGEVDPDVLQSFWSYSFASLSTGVRVNVIFLQDMYQRSLSTVNPEGLKTLGATWMDSDDAMAAAQSIGMTTPPAGTGKIAMKLTPNEIQGCAGDPVWEIDWIDAPPAEPVEIQHWIALNCTSAGGPVACDPAGDCFVVTP